MVPNGYEKNSFSLNHMFFDSLLDKLGDYSSHVNTHFASKSSKLLTLVPTEKEKVCVVDGGQVYSQVGSSMSSYDAIALLKGKEWALGLLDNVSCRIKKAEFVRFLHQLNPKEVTTPGFIELHCHLVTSAVLQQWFNFGPFGFHCERHTFISDYDLSYISRAVMYLDKGIPQSNWLLGYGLQEQLLQCHDRNTRSCLNTLLEQVYISRPLIILDADQPLAYANQQALDSIYKYLTHSNGNPFNHRAEFYQLIEQQGGLKDEQLLWILEVLPESQLQQYCYDLLYNMDKLVNNAKLQGIKHLGVADSHPVALNFLDLYRATSAETHID